MTSSEDSIGYDEQSFEEEEIFYDSEEGHFERKQSISSKKRKSALKDGHSKKKSKFPLETPETYVPTWISTSKHKHPTSFSAQELSTSRNLNPYFKYSTSISESNKIASSFVSNRRKDEEVQLPCEFCNSCISLQNFEAHQQKCFEKSKKKESLKALVEKRNQKENGGKQSINLFDNEEEEIQLTNRTRNMDTNSRRVFKFSSPEVNADDILVLSSPEKESPKSNKSNIEGQLIELDSGSENDSEETDLMKEVERKADQIKQVLLTHKTKLIKTQPHNLKNSLSHYQLDGLDWLYLLYKENINGILADEMGLGKTIQTIALFAKLLESGIEGPHLVICPATVLNNWANELSKWCPDLSFEIYQGKQTERQEQQIELINGEFNILLTTYNLVSGKSDYGFLKKFQFEYLVLDEAQNIKNAASQRSKAIMKLKAKHRLLLTGTPLQNNLQELWTLLSFLMPELFPTSFKEWKSTLIQTQSPNKDAVTKTKKIISAFVLRRLKSEVYQTIKPKKEKIEKITMESLQGKLYNEIVQHSRAEWAKHVEAKNISSNVVVPKNFLNNILSQLQKMVNHPILSRAFYTDSQITKIAKVLIKTDEYYQYSLEKLIEGLSKFSDLELHKICQVHSSLSNLQLTKDQILNSSGKLTHLKKLLSQLKEEGHRVLLFSQFTTMMDILEIFLQEHLHAYLRLDGSTLVEERQSLIDLFNTERENFFLFLLSTKAGGLGINLTSADTVIFYDFSFNPQVEKQAEDRCHRLGQEKEVTVYKFICSGTVEDHIIKMANKKKVLNDEILGEGNISQTNNEEEELKTIYQILEGIMDSQ